MVTALERPLKRLRMVPEMRAVARIDKRGWDCIVWRRERLRVDMIKVGELLRG